MIEGTVFHNGASLARAQAAQAAVKRRRQQTRHRRLMAHYREYTRDEAADAFHCSVDQIKKDEKALGIRCRVEPKEDQQRRRVPAAEQHDLAEAIQDLLMRWKPLPESNYE